MKNLMHILLGAILVCACTTTNKESNSSNAKPVVSVSLPVEAYFVDQLTCGTVDANVLIPQSAGHSDYSPLPSQMVELSNSKAYLAIGALDFETTWRERMQNANRDMIWTDLSKGITLIAENENGDGEEHHGHHHHHDPHYWLSPKRVATMASNMANALKTYTSANVDSALEAVTNSLLQLDSLFASIEGNNTSFMIYHPALTYLAEDYGFVQLEIEKDGNAPSPQSYMQQIENAKQAQAKIVFVQTGYDMQKAQSAANMIGATVVEFNPESIDYMSTMMTIYDALKDSNKQE